LRRAGAGIEGKKLPPALIRMALRYWAAKRDPPPTICSLEVDKIDELHCPKRLICVSDSPGPGMHPKEVSRMKLFSVYAKAVAKAVVPAVPGQPHAYKRILEGCARSTFDLFVRKSVNSHGIPGGHGSAVCPSLSFFNHSCSYNAAIKITVGMRFTAVAVRDIHQGEEVCICYVDAGQAGEVRRAELRRVFWFECRCAKCTHELKS